MTQPLSSAEALYLEGIRDGDPQGAIERYTGARYTQHSTGVGDGREGFVAFFTPFLVRNPKREIEILHGIEDGRYAFVHVYQSLNDGADRWVTMDLFDTDADGRIVEHWDVIESFREPTASGHGMVESSAAITGLARTDANKAVVLEFTKQVLQTRHFDRIERFVSADLVQHGASIGDGRDGLHAWLTSDAGGHYDMLFQLIGQGNLVVTYGKRHAAGVDRAVFDLYRLDDGLIVEHWNVSEEILPRDQWGNAGKF